MCQKRVRIGFDNYVTHFLDLNMNKKAKIEMFLIGKIH